MRKLTALATALLATAALGYVMPAWHVLRRMADGKEDSGAGSWRMAGTASLYGTAAAQAAATFLQPPDARELQVEAEAWVKQPGRCRLELRGGGGKAAAVSNAGKVRAEGPAVEALQVGLQQACALLGSRSPGAPEARATVERHLASLGVEPKKSQLSRFAGQVTYLLGEGAEGKPHLLVYKEALTPARLRFSDAQGQAWDVRLLDYATAGSGKAFPRVLEVWRGTELQLRFTALSAEPRSAAPDALFQAP
ncbi:MAG: hypothetical protein FJ086_08020 [Deltaproteobacteria bacterium]|nr:hypothetical protein [Deltaproteobacteria bacterium]